MDKGYNPTIIKNGGEFPVNLPGWFYLYFQSK